MELCFTGISSRKGYPGGKSRRDTPFFIVSPVRSAGGAIFCAKYDNKM